MPMPVSFFIESGLTGKSCLSVWLTVNENESELSERIIINIPRLCRGIFIMSGGSERKPTMDSNLAFCRWAVKPLHFPAGLRNCPK